MRDNRFRRRRSTDWSQLAESGRQITSISELSVHRSNKTSSTATDDRRESNVSMKLLRQTTNEMIYRISVAESSSSRQPASICRKSIELYRRSTKGQCRPEWSFFRRRCRCARESTDRRRTNPEISNRKVSRWSRVCCISDRERFPWGKFGCRNIEFRRRFDREPKCVRLERTSLLRTVGQFSS